MPKVTIDRETFKALASDARLEILKALDGRKMNLSEIARKTNLSKATVHEHLTKLVDANLVKKIEREGHKWTYYKLSWKGASLLHPENTKIVIMFSISFLFLSFGIMQFIFFANGSFVNVGELVVKETYTFNGTAWDNSFFNGTNNTLPEGGNVTRSYIAILDGGMVNYSYNLYEEVYNITKEATILGQDPINLNIVMDDEYSEGMFYKKSFSGAPANILMEDEIPSGAGSWEYENGTFVNYIPIAKINAFFQDPFYLYTAITLVIISIAMIAVSAIKLWKNRVPAL